MIVIVFYTLRYFSRKITPSVLPEHLFWAGMQAGMVTLSLHENTQKIKPGAVFFTEKVSNLPLYPSKIHSKTKNDQTAPPVSGGQSGRGFS